ncbi:MAG TPA: SPFH domain-containing protein [Polyangia bacterium]|nr:SPFH domain-containing protein [Polyangia bacterium]
MTLTTLFSSLLSDGRFYAVFAALMFAAAVILSSTWIIREDQSGLVVKKYGPPLASGRLVALAGEAGYQARLLAPGWHFIPFRWQYTVVKVPLLVVPAGEIALVVAADGAPIPAERILGKEVACNDYQDAEAFLRRGGERGRQLGFLTAGSYRINPALFEVITTRSAQRHGVDATSLRVRQVPAEAVGIVTVLDGRPLPTGDLAGPPVADHDSFQRGQKFIDAGGCRGLQEDVLLAGSWNLNPWFVEVKLVRMIEIPIGYVGVVVSYVGREHVDVSGADFTHGDLVEKGRKGVWVEPLLPGKHPLNTEVMKVELVPTTNIVLNWAERTEAHQYDERLSSILVRSKDGFSFSLDVAQIIHVAAKNAPRVISRVGSMQNLVDHVLQPTVGNYFRNSAQEVTVLDFLSARSQRQHEAKAAIGRAVEAYDVECIDTLIGDIVPPPELMKTQTDRKIADELKRTYDVQRESQEKRQELERERAVAELQAEVVRSEQMVRIATQNAQAAAEAAKGNAAATRLEAEAQADATRALGAARAQAYRDGKDALGPEAYTAMQIATIVGERNIKVVPDVAVSGAGGGAGLAEALMARMLAGANGNGGASSSNAKS